MRNLRLNGFIRKLQNTVTELLSIRRKPAAVASFRRSSTCICELRFINVRIAVAYSQKGRNGGPEFHRTAAGYLVQTWKWDDRISFAYFFC
jgi:hypothetical protein